MLATDDLVTSDFRYDGPDSPAGGAVVLITGAGRGIGRSHAIKYGRLGARVCVDDPGFNEKGERLADLVVAEIKAFGGTAFASYIPVGTPEAAEKLVAEVVEKYGRIDVLVNNAGIIRDAYLTKMTDENIRLVIETHLLGAMYLTRLVYGLMFTQRSGHIIFTTSDSGIFGSPGQFNYAAAKAGLWGLVATLSGEGAAFGIFVNGIAPIAKTPMTEKVPIAFEADPDSISSVVVFLTHPSTGVTGMVVSVGGEGVSIIKALVTRGVVLPKVTPEALRDAWSGITELDGAHYPTCLTDAINIRAAAIRAAKLVDQPDADSVLVDA
jgi:NAD(P)-dependent dehydrogenase (short-subunit alcohol dehydrogenase family)